MEVECPLCPKGRQFSSEAKLVRHIVTQHRDRDQCILYQCLSCQSTFQNVNALKVHHWRNHRAGIQQETDDVMDEDDQEESEEQSPVLDKASSAPKLEEELQFCATALLIKIKEKLNGTQTLVDEMIQGVDKLFDIFISMMQNQFIQRTSCHALSIDEILDKIESLRGQSLFTGMKSQDDLLKYLINANSLVPPKKIVALSKEVVTGNSIKKVDVDYGYIVPFIPMLEKVLSCPEVLYCVDHPKSEEGVISSPLDGYAYKNHPTVARDPKTLAVGLYQDDAGSTDLASSKASENNVRYIYWTLFNIYPELRSSTQSINLLCCVKTQVIKKYGSDIFLRNFIEDINKLSGLGVSLNINGVQRLFHAIFLFSSGDNPASASLGGFKESHFAELPCRQCFTPKVNLYDCFNEEELPLRSKVKHEEQVKEVEEFEAQPAQAREGVKSPSVKYGINCRSALMSIDGCDVTKCLPQDLMHDVIEGTLHLEICLLLNHAVFEKKTITINVLNQRILMFSKYFKVNKPSPLDLKRIKERNLNATANEVLNLGYMLPFVLRKKNMLTGKMESVCNDENLKSYCLRLQILNLLMSDKFVLMDIYKLRHLQKSHHTLFSSLYDVKILKLHTELHFGVHILLYGPPRQQWCFRYEAKHAFFKRLCRILKAFKNLTFSLATRHQMRQGGMMLLSSRGEAGPFLESPTKYGSSYQIVFSNVRYQDSLLAVFPGIQANSIVLKYNTVVLDGVSLKRQSVICLSTSNVPQFGVILGMYSYNSKLAIVYKNLITNHFDVNLNSFSVKYGARTSAILSESIPFHHQLFFIRSVGANYVIMPCKLNH